MNDQERPVVDSAAPPSAGETNPSPATERASSSVNSRARNASRRWWIGLLIQPALLLAGGTLFIVGLGVAQRFGLVSAGSHPVAHASPGDEATQYICPMMCTPPQTEPGRCPVCAMELVPAAAGGDKGEVRSVRIDPAARRLANIRTVAVRAAPRTRTIRAVGELSYDEGSLKTLSAYVDGRLDRLYVDYTGAVVEKEDHLALLYSPRLYSAQVELLLAKKASDESRSATRLRVVESNRDLYASAKQRLIELGMTAPQIEQLEQAGEANSRMFLCAPIRGTVIEKTAVEGQYVKEGEAIFQLADLSTLWLMLELFPEDAATIRYGQRVQAEVQSLPGSQFSGRVAFLDPHVDPATRTVGVRVVIPNPDGQLRVGDFAKATIEAPTSTDLQGESSIYDPELADKWISPRHPHIVASQAGDCPICGVDLVPATEFGFVSRPTTQDSALVVPRDAVLMAGDASVVYIEIEPGRFQLRRVVLGPTCGDQIVVLEGVEAGEQVATRGNFLIDSQMQLAGKPSLIDPTKAGELPMESLNDEILGALAGLSEQDRRLVEQQGICPVTGMALGSMGTPPKVAIAGRDVFLCCAGCEPALQENPKKYLDAMSRDAESESEEEREIASALSKLTTADRELAQRQRFCPVADLRLGSMGPPEKVDVKGEPVFICCAGCRDRLLRDPDKYLVKLSNASVPESVPAVPSIGAIREAGVQFNQPPISFLRPFTEERADASRLPSGDPGVSSKTSVEFVR